MLERKLAQKESSNFSNRVKKKLEVMMKYNTTFKSYDELHRYEQYEKYDSVKEYIISLINDNVSILDLGCGTGLLYEYVSNACNKCEAYYVGLDISINMLKLAKRKILKNGRIFSDLILSDAEYLPFRSKCFDTVFAFTVIQNIPCPRCFLLEIKRVVKRQRTAIVSVPKKARMLVNIKEYSSVRNGGRDFIYFI